VEPFLPLLEHQALSSAQTRRSGNNHRSSFDVLQEASRCSDRWVRVAAIQMLDQSGHSVLPSLMVDPDPVVRAAAEQLSQRQLNHQSNGEYFMNRLLFLKKVSLFSYLSLDDLLLLQDALKVDHYMAGELVFPEGAIGRNFYIVQEGSIRISKGPDGVQHQLATLGPGDCFGEMSLFDEEPRSAAALALVDCTLLNLDKDRFLSMISQRPQIALQICKVLSMRLRETDRWAAAQSPPFQNLSISSGSANAAD
jgi:CRP-like cAMP-binding protein